ncbi:hypothetical protein FB451DRAFT_1369141 [Mycena latifolia]|nr:hypothetical protein FB451DRAFT_1369141 [Mycena latifolia]
MMCALISLSTIHSRTCKTPGHNDPSRAEQQTPISTGAILDVPPELWGLVAKSSGRQSLARLSSVSHGFHAILSPLLYGTATTDPPLSGTQATLLIEMLGTMSMPHPGLFVRRLVFPPYWIARRINAQACLAALECLFDAPGDGRPVRGSALRALEWGEREVMDALGPLLCTPGYFPNLKEILIQCPSSCTRFDFLRIPRLEKIEVDLSVRGYETWRPSLDALSAELVTLPLSSPLLHTLKLKLTMVEVTASESPPWDAYSDLLTAMNQLRLPALTALELSIGTEYFDSPAPAVDFLPLLREHPGLIDLTLHAEGMRIPTPQEVALFLPRLRAFKGSLDHCAAVAARARELVRLFMSLPEYCDDDALPKLFPPGSAPTVAQLNVRVVDDDGSLMPFPMQLSPESLSFLVQAFPNLTYLDVSIGEKIKDYSASLAAVPHLEYLCLRAHKEVPEHAWNKPDSEIFPVAKYAVRIREALLPVLTRLTNVRLVLHGDRSIWPSGCSSCDEARWSPGTLWVEYQFWVRRMEGERELVLVEDEA